MTKQVKLRRGTSLAHETFTGASAELTVDTTEQELVLHDGVTPGGKRIGKRDNEVVLPVDTVADLRDLEPTTGGQQINLLGHTVAGIGGGLFWYDASDTASADNNGTVIVTGGAKRWKRTEYSTTDVTYFGAMGDGVTDDTLAIQAAADSLTNTHLTPNQNGEGATLNFPAGVYIISSPLVMRTSDTAITGMGAVLKASTGVFDEDVGVENLGKWMIIWDPIYNHIPHKNLYHCHIFDLKLDMSDRLDLKGIWIGGGRNSSSIERVTFVGFYQEVINLGKSSIDGHSITQGFLVSNCSAIWDGNVGAQEIPADKDIFVISAGNENTFFNVDVVGSAQQDSIGSGFAVGTGTYNCGGNKFIACGGSNYRGSDIEVASTTGLAVGQVLTTGDGFKSTIREINGTTLRCQLLTNGSSAFVPRAGDTLTTSGGATTIVSASFGKTFKLRNSWGTTIEALKLVETTVCGVFIDNPAGQYQCIGNIVRGGRLYEQTSSCLVALGSCAFNTVEADLYTHPVSVLNGCEYASMNVRNSSEANISKVKFVSPSVTNSVFEYLTTGGINVINTSDSAGFTGKGGLGGLRVNEFFTQIFDKNGVQVLDRNGKPRLETANNSTPSVSLKDGAGNAMASVTNDGRVIMVLPTANPGVTNQLWNDGGILKIS